MKKNKLFLYMFFQIFIITTTYAVFLSSSNQIQLGSYLAIKKTSTYNLLTSAETRLLWSYIADVDVYSVDISANGNSIVAGGNYNITLFNKNGFIRHHPWRYIFQLAISEDARYYVCGSEYFNNMSLFNTKTGFLWNYT